MGLLCKREPIDLENLSTPGGWTFILGRVDHKIEIGKQRSVMSAFGGKADMFSVELDVCFVP
jgi:hypothetical protein